MKQSVLVIWLRLIRWWAWWWWRRCQTRRTKTSEVWTNRSRRSKKWSNCQLNIRNCSMRLALLSQRYVPRASVIYDVSVSAVNCESQLTLLLVMLNSNFFQNRNSNTKNRLKLETCFLLYPSSMVKRVRISTFDFHSRFADRRSVRSAHIKRSEDLTCALSDSDSCVAAAVRLTDAFTTVRLTPTILPPQ